MPTELYHLNAFLIAMTVVLWITPTIKTLGLKSGRVDKPDERKVHSQPMVRLGGVSIFCGTLIAVIILWSLGGFNSLGDNELWPLLGIALGSIAFFAIGLLDDLFELSAISRLIMQFIVAGIAWQLGVRIEYLAIPFGDLISVGLLSAPITLIWLVGMVNAINWIDGLDGLAAGVSGIAAVSMLVAILYVQDPTIALLVAALAGGALGFLRYNFNPAQIFMGDGGSYFIGFALASIGVVGLSKSMIATAVMLPYLILAVPLVDMTIVVFSRIASGASPFKPDKRHLHHRLLALGLSHKMTVLFIYALTFWVGSVSLVLAGIASSSVLVIVATLCLAYLTWQIWRQKELRNDHE